MRRPLAFVLASLLAGPALADSAITSTVFHPAYADVPAVARAAAAQLDEKTLEALRAPATTFEIRAAIINAISWKYEGKPLAAQYRAHLRKVTGSDQPKTSVDHFNLGYLMAMGDYFHSAQALPLLKKAAELEPGDQAVQIVRAIVVAQDYPKPNVWCPVWKAATAGPFRKPMRAAGLDLALGYISGGECEPKPKTPPKAAPAPKEEESYDDEEDWLFGP